MTDNFQQAWQSEGARTRVRVDADLLLREVQRNQRDFRAMIFRRDVVEVGVGLLMVPVWIVMGIWLSSPWTWYLGVPALLWMVGFLVVDRRLHKQVPRDPVEPLQTSVIQSLAEVEHQIWLLSNVFWWYLLPPGIAILTFFTQVALQTAGNRLEAFAIGSFSYIFLLGLYAFLDFINQRAVRVQLEPRRQELLSLQASLVGESSTEGNAAMGTASNVSSSGFWKRWLIVTVLSFATFAVIVLAFARTGASQDKPPQSSSVQRDSLAGQVAGLRQQKKLVGLAAMVMVDGQVIESAADGERKLGSGKLVETGDRWHLGSITKSITATMIGRLVETGRMKWTDTVGERFPDAAIHEDWKKVTLRQLLTHTAGAPANFSLAVRLKRPAAGPELTRARRDTVLGVMAQKPEHPPGGTYAYSNVGYTIAGAMAEQATGVTWEDLVTKEVFEPLKLTGAGFGPPKSPEGTLDQPRGHRAGLMKVAVDDQADNTPIMGPAGTVHMTLGDLCAYATEHLLGERGAGKLLNAETYKSLHTPELDNYARGWVKKDPSEELPHTVFWHNGSNTMWYALVVFVPEKNLVVAVASNDGDRASAEAAAWEIVKASVKQRLGSAADSSQ